MPRSQRDTRKLKGLEKRAREKHRRLIQVAKTGTCLEYRTAMKDWERAAGASTKEARRLARPC